MKLYRLLKDLPTFNAGDIFELRGDGCLYWMAYLQDKLAHQHCRHWQTYVMAYHRKTLERFPNIFSDWFEEIKEPKESWYIDWAGIIRSSCDEYGWEDAKSIGNYFETNKQAEKAVEKLKAWQRLKDKGFKVDLWDYDGGNYQERIKTGRILFRIKDYEENDKDLDLLFSQEEGR